MKEVELEVRWQPGWHKEKLVATLKRGAMGRGEKRVIGFKVPSGYVTAGALSSRIAAHTAADYTGYPSPCTNTAVHLSGKPNDFNHAPTEVWVAYMDAHGHQGFKWFGKWYIVVAKVTSAAPIRSRRKVLAALGISPAIHRRLPDQAARPHGSTRRYTA